MKFLIICVVIAYVNIAGAEFTEDDCNKRCTKILAPVCGSNALGTYRTFPNQCIMDIENCKSRVRNEPGFMLLSLTTCEDRVKREVTEADCNKACIDLYAPVCGDNGRGNKIFSNKCFMDNANCRAQLLKQSVFKPVDLKECVERVEGELTEADCNKACIEVYAPICGDNGHGNQIFSNKCFMDNANCRAQVRKESVFKPVDIKVCEDRVKREITEADYAHCDKMCPAVYKPVCGYNGHGKYQTFSNDCHMDNENCRVQVRKEPVFMLLPLITCKQRE